MAAPAEPPPVAIRDRGARATALGARHPDQRCVLANFRAPAPVVRAVTGILWRKCAKAEFRSVF